MNIVSEEKYKIPEWLPCYLLYGDDSIFDYYDSRDTDKVEVDKWLNALPSGGVWQFGEEESEFVRDDIFNKYGTCVEATYTVLG